MVTVTGTNFNKPNNTQTRLYGYSVAETCDRIPWRSFMEASSLDAPCPYDRLIGARQTTPGAVQASSGE